MWKVLDNPWLNRAGTAVFILGGLQTAVRWLMGLPLNIVGVALFAIGIALMLSPRLSTWINRRRHRGYSPAERRERLYPRRNDRLDLGERCSEFAMNVRVFNEEHEWRRERAIGAIAEELRQSESDLGPDQARKDAEL